MAISAWHVGMAWERVGCVGGDGGGAPSGAASRLHASISNACARCKANSVLALRVGGRRGLEEIGRPFGGPLPHEVGTSTPFVYRGFTGERLVFDSVMQRRRCGGKRRAT